MSPLVLGFGAATMILLGFDGTPLPTETAVGAGLMWICLSVIAKAGAQ